DPDPCVIVRSDEHATHYERILIKQAPPRVMAENDHLLGAGVAVVAVQQAAECGLGAEQLEEVGRDNRVAYRYGRVAVEKRDRDRALVVDAGDVANRTAVP